MFLSMDRVIQIHIDTNLPAGSGAVSKRVRSILSIVIRKVSKICVYFSRRLGSATGRVRLNLWAEQNKEKLLIRNHLFVISCTS